MTDRLSMTTTDSMTTTGGAPADAWREESEPEWMQEGLEDDDDVHTGTLFRLRASDIITVAALGLIQAAALAGFVLVTRTVIDALVPDGVGRAAELTFERALWSCGVLAALAVVLGIARSIEFTVAERAGYLVVRRLRMAMYAHLQRMLPAHLRHRARGGLLLRLTGDLSMLRMWLSRGVLEGISAAIVLIVGIGVLCWLDVWLAITVIAVLAAGSALSLVFGRSMREATRTMRRRRSLLMGNIDEQLGTLAVSQVSGRTRGEFSRLSRQNASLTDALIRVAGLRGRLRGIAVAVSLVSVAAVLAVGVIEARRGQVGVDVVIVAALLARYLARPVRTLGLTHDYWHRGLVSRQKVTDFLTSSSRDAAEEDLPALIVRGGRIEFQGVTVPGVLADFTAVADRGELVVITGPSGSGKSTLLELVARQTEPVSGAVMVDGQNLAQTAPSSVGRMMGVAGPNLPLLKGSVLRNATYAARHVAPGEVQRILRTLGLDESLAQHGFSDIHDWVSEGGSNLTLSDRQLLALARAMMGTPRILLLDEPLMGLDAEARSRAREALLRHRGTVLLVTQDPDALALADSVWVMGRGVPVTVQTGEEYRAQLWRERGERNRRWHFER